MAKGLTIFLIAVDLLIAVFYLAEKSYAKTFYWVSAGSITLSTLFLK